MSDYIEREAALQTIESCAGWSRPLDSAYEEIQNIPAADIAPIRHGYWMDSSNGWTCSECCSDNIRDTKWCPNCGAKMDRKVPD